MTDKVLGGANVKLAPLISFNCIVDEDIGLVNLIRKDYLDDKVFNKDFFDMEFYEILKALYYRKEENPLYLFAKEGISRDTLDSYYLEFKEKCEREILDMSITTEIFNLIDFFNTSQDIIPSILCYTQNQLDIIEQEQTMKKNHKILFSKLSEKDKKSFSQFYFKYIKDIEPFINIKLRAFYISRAGLNINDDENDVRDYDFMERFYRNYNSISLFDLYKKEIIGGK